MMTAQADNHLPFSAMSAEHVRGYWRRGYAVIRGVFAPDEVAAMAAAFDRVHARGIAYPQSYRHGNVFFRQAADANLGRILRLAQWPAYFDPILDGVRTDPRMLAILEPLIGGDIKQIINQMHWKTPGAAGTEFGYHQDIRFRRPREAYRDPLHAYVQMGIAIDPHHRWNGCMTLYPGSHTMGELALEGDGRIMDKAFKTEDLVQVGLDPGEVIDLELEPGDVALWNLFTVHGSRTNRSAVDRRFYLNGYVRATDCDRGAWAFRAGQPRPLGEPVPIHYDRLHERPEPHFVPIG